MVMDVHKETMNLWSLTCGCEVKGILKIFGVRGWVNTKQNPEGVFSGHEAPPLFILASLGDETGRTLNLRVNKAHFLLFIIFALGSFSRSTAVYTLFTCLPNLVLLSCESNILLLSYTFVLYWGPLPHLLNLIYLIYLIYPDLGVFILWLSNSLWLVSSSVQAREFLSLFPTVNIQSRKLQNGQ